MAKRNDARLRRAVCSLALSLVMFVTALFTYAGFSLGWFSSNQKVGAGGAQLGVAVLDVTAKFEAFDKAGNSVSIDGERGDISFEKLLPGDTVSIRLTLTNNTEKDLRADFSLLAPEACETPVVSADGFVYYYLGSQIRVKEMKLNDTLLSGPGGANELRLLAPADGDYAPTPDGVKFGVNKLLIPQDLPLYSGAILPAKNGETVSPQIFRITLEFVNAQFDQSALKKFGKNGEVCFRQLDAAYTAVSAS